MLPIPQVQRNLVSQAAFTSSSIAIGSVGRAPAHQRRSVTRLYLQEGVAGQGRELRKRYIFVHFPLPAWLLSPYTFFAFPNKITELERAGRNNKCKGYKQHRLPHEEWFLVWLCPWKMHCLHSVHINLAKGVPRS